MRGLVVVVIVAACGGSEPRPTAPSNKPIAEPAPSPEPAPRRTAIGEPIDDAHFEAIMKQAVAMFVAMGAAVDVAGGDCGKIADGLDLVAASYRPVIVRSKQLLHTPGSSERAQAWMMAHQAEVMGAMTKISNAGQTCAGDPKFTAMMERLSHIGD